MEKCAKFSLKFLCLMLILIVAFCFCACAQVNTATIANDDGSIDELVTITLDRQQFFDAGYDLADYILAQQDIEEEANLTVGRMVLAFNAQAESRDETKRQKGKLYKTKNTGVWVGNTFKIGLHFADLGAYKFYYGITEETNNEPTIEKHFFYDKVITKGYTMYASYNSLYNEISAYYKQKYPLLAEEKNELTYTHVLDYRRQKSDADFVQKIDGKYYHTWILAEGETNKVVTIYYNLANREHCILVCILISLALCAILFLIGFVITKVKAKKKKKNN